MNGIRYKSAVLLTVFIVAVSFAFAQSDENKTTVSAGKVGSKKWYQLNSKAMVEDSVSVLEALATELINKSEAVLPGRLKRNYLLVDSVSMELMVKDSVQASWGNKAKYKALALVEDEADSNVWASFLAPLVLLLTLVYSAYSLIKLFVIRED